MFKLTPKRTVITLATTAAVVAVALNVFGSASAATGRPVPAAALPSV
ncbi:MULTISPECIES: hypothetical protein [unclassified Streptomyces]|nr:MULTISPECIES: hypothetical protein [unclassified Streptomyces]MBT2406118.1 hypothetical protein [Streptomyces sp. ISL-21]MBT2457735.1 hypothetical protein [Streptomyces sp. ISL-86]MBT2609176.1 hypothetical protein [Streptomyces sp. ISL-87]